MNKKLVFVIQIDVPAVKEEVWVRIALDMFKEKVEQGKNKMKIDEVKLQD